MPLSVWACHLRTRPVTKADPLSLPEVSASLPGTSRAATPSQQPPTIEHGSHSSVLHRPRPPRTPSDASPTQLLLQLRAAASRRKQQWRATRPSCCAHPARPNNPRAPLTPEQLPLPTLPEARPRLGRPPLRMEGPGALHPLALRGQQERR